MSDPIGNRVFDDGRELINAVLATLPEREAAVVIMRYGLEDGTPRTLGEIGQKYGVSHQRINLLLTSAIARLKLPGRSMTLMEYDELGRQIAPVDIAPTHKTT
ncbi:sigma factor-like helix-turn-helix DNA-binding protein, partial [Sphaerisporangium rufum]|uniref:sigma factor-like helix-turn-helix DNA-binding protein n=1 Tax=Sphaerisporangium rufum TaxID=1381558 RepID=UPI0023B25FF9